MRESAVTFGPQGGLVGVITEPPEGTAAARRAVIVSNIGMHHRVGPYRIWVELARALAACGLTVLRFDLSGMGDSAQRSDANTPTDRADRDMDDAMTMLTERLGISEFILIGLCSGVDSTHSAAVRSARVVGAAFIDGYSYPTTGFHVRHYLVRPLQLGRWISYVKRRMMAKEIALATSDTPAVFVRQYPTAEQFRSDVRAMATRGTRLLFVYSGTWSGTFNSPRQLFETLGPGLTPAQVEVQTLFAADHVFTSVARRADLIRRLARWVTSISA